MAAPYRSSAGNGFTLIELIMVIVITGIIAGMISIFISKPMEGYVDVSNRAELVDAADSALQMMARDIRAALPNSTRCNPAGCVNATAFELLHTADGVRYRKGGYAGGADPYRQLDATQPDADFNSIGTFQNIALPYDSSTHAPPPRLVIYNLGAPGYDAYQAVGTTGIMTPSGTTFTITDDSATHPGEDHIHLSQAQQFGTDSPRQRLFLVDTPISYVCDTATGLLTRYSHYPIAGAASFPPAGASTSAPLTQYLTACQIQYDPGTAARGGLVTMSLTLTKNGESVTLLQQVHVDNAP